MSITKTTINGYKETLRGAKEGITAVKVGTKNQMLDEIMNLEKIKETLIFTYFQLLFDLSQLNTKYDLYKSTAMGLPEIKSLKSQVQRELAMQADYPDYNLIAELKVLEGIYDKLIKSITQKQKIYELYSLNHTGI